MFAREPRGDGRGRLWERLFAGFGLGLGLTTAVTGAIPQPPMMVQVAPMSTPMPDLSVGSMSTQPPDLAVAEHLSAFGEQVAEPFAEQSAEMLQLRRELDHAAEQALWLGPRVLDAPARARVGTPPVVPAPVGPP